MSEIQLANYCVSQSCRDEGLKLNIVQDTIWNGVDPRIAATQVEVSDLAFFLDRARGANDNLLEQSALQILLLPFFAFLNAMALFLVEHAHGRVVATSLVYVVSSRRWICYAAANGGDAYESLSALLETAIEKAWRLKSADIAAAEDHLTRFVLISCSSKVKQRLCRVRDSLSVSEVTDAVRIWTFLPGDGALRTECSSGILHYCGGEDWKNAFPHLTERHNNALIDAFARLKEVLPSAIKVIKAATKRRTSGHNLSLTDEENVTMRQIFDLASIIVNSTFMSSVVKEKTRLPGFQPIAMRRLGRLYRTIGKILQYRDGVHATVTAGPLLSRKVAEVVGAKRWQSLDFDELIKAYNESVEDGVEPPDHFRIVWVDLDQNPSRHDQNFPTSADSVGSGRTSSAFSEPASSVTGITRNSHSSAIDAADIAPSGAAINSKRIPLRRSLGSLHKLFTVQSQANDPADRLRMRQGCTVYDMYLVYREPEIQGLIIPEQVFEEMLQDLPHVVKYGKGKNKDTSKWFQLPKRHECSLHSEHSLIRYLLARRTGPNPLRDDSSDMHPPQQLWQVITYLVGCSKRSCELCTRQLQLTNDRFGTHFLMSGSSGRADPNWLVPSDIAMLKDLNRYLTKQVWAAIEDMENRYKLRLRKQLADPRQSLDSMVSIASGSDSAAHSSRYFPPLAYHRPYPNKKYFSVAKNGPRLSL